MDQVKIGAFLKRLRKEKGLTQEQLAERWTLRNSSMECYYALLVATGRSSYYSDNG